MGLLAESKSRKISSKDPNNTKWVRDTNTFGQKMLRAQGWEPGQFLGIRDATYSELHTAANASYIRVSMKDDVKGLGWNKSKEDEVTGLDVFSDLLSRLNGKSTAVVEAEKEVRLAMKTNRYVEQKYGAMRFVRGGLLVGDKTKECLDCEEDADTTKQETDDEVTSKKWKEKQSKKRKAADMDNDSDEDSNNEKKRRKEERRLRKTLAKKTSDCAEESSRSSDNKEKKKTKKKKTKTKKRKDKEAETDEEMAGSDSEDGAEEKCHKSKPNEKKSPALSDCEVDESRKGKKEKRLKKKDKRKGKKEQSSGSEQDASNSGTTTGISTPTEPSTGTGTPRGSRNFVRSRFIAAKRQAMLDTKALNQIFMVKT
ncbi:hypothetical protein DCS_07490 [Drechmeria coniospora]|uniref:PinX1-related protein 1 n=1 Tax=Drechmeria coniospora TaxID=98403 RepID=A0A151GEK2_DRECN|nr:hypothetical protein DCS_07490 [Drechmeria coniospora]KYK55527.1 hypothetical protein DCS_07490 [Drechmeria coniospora]ODA81866.1 hypothetical protein RJ55_00371 [Drechmeria coniospora]